MIYIYIIVAVIAAVALLYFGASIVFSNNKGAGIAGVVGTVVVFGIFSLLLSITQVDARSVGIRTDFGRYTETLKPGLQLTAPWSSVEEFTTRLQTTDLNDLDGSRGNSVYVAFSAPKDVDENGVPKTGEKSVAGGGNGNINAVVRWQISDNQSDQGARALWEKYKDFDSVSEKLVLSTSQDIIADVANDFPAGVASVNQTEIGNEVAKRLGTALQRYGVVVDSVSIKRVVLDKATTSSLQRIVDNINKTTAAAEEQKRAIIDNQTAALRQKTGALSAQANERYCLDVVNSWNVAQNGPLPATFNCGLGSTANVLVGAGK